MRNITILHFVNLIAKIFLQNNIYRNLKKQKRLLENHLKFFLFKKILKIWSLQKITNEILFKISQHKGITQFIILNQINVFTVFYEYMLTFERMQHILNSLNRIKSSFYPKNKLVANDILIGEIIRIIAVMNC